MSRDDELLMEALMLFSSEESDTSSAFSEDSDIETKANASRQGQLTSRAVPSGRPDDDFLLDNAVQDVLREFPMNQHNQEGARKKMFEGKRSFDEYIEASVRATPRYGRKRSKKCTYAARRQEVSCLKSLTLKLEMQLEYFQHHSHYRRQLNQQGGSAMHRLQLERQQLIDSQAENARLRSLVEANEVRVRQLQAAMPLGHPLAH